MRFRTGHIAVCETEMTPMIDMAFQLISFFMFVMNFSTELVQEEVQLPVTQLAQPVLTSKEEPIVLNLDADGTLFLPGRRLNVSEPAGLNQLSSYLYQEAALARLRLKARGLPPDAPLPSTIILRADRATPFRLVRQVLRTCREAGFSKYSLRAETQARIPAGLGQEQ